MNPHRDGDDPTPTGNTASGVQSVDRAITVLEILARQGEAGVSEVAAEIAVHKSTAFRLLTALENRGMTEQAEDRGKYRLGHGILRLAGAISSRMDLTRQSRPICHRLANTLGETVNIAIPQAHHVVNLDQVHGPSTVTVHNWIGQLTPLHATSSGKILLAHLPHQHRTNLITTAGLPRFTPHTITTRKQLTQQLTTARARGYALAIEEYEIGLNAMAAPIRAHTSDVIAAISVSGPAYRLTEHTIHHHAPTLIDAANQISRRLGYPD